MLYHGTVLASVQHILAEGVDVSKGRAATDFGRGFYTTTDLYNAREWAERKARQFGGEAAVVRVTLDRIALGDLKAIVFIRGSLVAEEYWSFVRNCRLGLPHRPLTKDFYDVAYGPVAKIWSGNTDSATWADYDQISFHTAAAQDMLNDRRVCTLEMAE